MDSILLSIKKLLGITAEYEHYDADIIMHINTTFIVLRQLGIGPKEGFAIENADAVWNDFIDADDDISVAMVKSYMYAKVRLMFDPPLSTAHIEALKQSVSEFEWRLNSEADYSITDGEEENQNGE